MPAEANLVEFPRKAWREHEGREPDEWKELLEATRVSATFDHILESLQDMSSWQALVTQASEQLSTVVGALSSPLLIEAIEFRIARIEDKLASLQEGLLAPVVVPVHSLEPEPFELLRKVEVLIQPSGDGFVASFLDANLSISGETQHEALANLKALMVDVFEELHELGEGKLGPGPKRQLRILQSLISPKVEWEG